MTETLADRLREILPKSQHGKIDKILAAAAEMPVEGIMVSEIEVLNARVTVETVEVYGLSIGLDANGNASGVCFPYGAEVTVVW